MLRKIFVFVLCLVIGSMLAVPAMAVPADKSVITIRPGSDWSDAKYSQNPATNAQWIWYQNPETDMNIVINHFFYMTPFEGAIEPDVKVTQRELNDGTGRAVVTVVERGKNAPAIIFNTYDLYAWYANPYENTMSSIIGNPWKMGQVFNTDLRVDYMIVHKFYINDPLQELQFWHDIDVNDRIMNHAVVSGKGTLSAHALIYEFTPGKSAEVIVNQVGLQSIEPPPESPGLGYTAELVDVHEIGE